MKKRVQPQKAVHALIIYIILVLTACGGGSDRGRTVGPRDGRSFPSPGAPSGSDAISSSTNQSDKEEETDPRPDPFAGASYIKPPVINNYGSVSLSYAVDVPPGRAGMAPSVGLSYSSSGGDGLAGMGWSLGTGLGVISRTTSHGQLYYDYRDTFTYNGKRLVKVEGGRTEENGVYRLEIESGFSKFELTNAEEGGVWYVYDKAGTVTVYGSALETRIYHPDDETKTYIWNFSSSTDLNGNYMRAEYDTSSYDEQHILYLKEIRYTGNVRAGHEPRQWVRFHYKEREDAYVSKAPGFIMCMDRLLDRVEVGWDSGGFLSNETVLWDYTLEYTTSADSNRPVLVSIESSREVTGPQFHYQEAVHSFAWQLVANPHAGDPEVNPETTRYFEGDFNGDGISDMVFFNPETGYWKAAQGQAGGGYTFPVYGSRFKGYDSAEKIQFFKGNVSGDYNGDGRSDIAMYLPETREFWVAEHNGQSFDFRLYGRLAVDIDIMKCEWFTGDYDGNGLSDSVLFDEAGGDWWLMSNTGGAFSFVKFSHKFKNLFRSDYAPDSNMDSVSTGDDSPQGGARDTVHFLNGDYNGDGRTDISVYDKRSGHWWVGSPASPLNPPIGGTASLEIEWKLYRVFTAPEQALFAHDRFSGDFNGDGFSDFLLFDRETGEWILGAVSDGNITFTVWSRAPQFKDITRWLQGDFNGDGRTDIGFYSKTDHNFWIGEAAPDGFRYRVYNNLSYGPDPEQVLEKAPLPRDEVQVTGLSAVVSSMHGTAQVTCQYDGNPSAGRGELIITGNFTGDDAVPETVVYDKAAHAVYAVSGNNTLSTTPVLSDIDLTGDSTDPASYTVLYGKAVKYSGERDGIFLYRKTANRHEFSVVHNDGEWKHTPLGDFAMSDVPFDLTESLYLTGYFTGTERSVLVLDPNTDEYNGEPRFVSVAEPESVLLTIQRDGLSDSAFNELFKEYAHNKEQVRFFTGDFGDTGTLLMADLRDPSNHVWYRAAVSGSTINFTRLEGSVQLVTTGLTGSYRATANDAATEHYLDYATAGNGRTQFHRVTIANGAVTAKTYPLLSSLYTFKGEYDSDDNAIVYYNTRTYSLVLGVSSYAYQNLALIEYKPKRDDLYQKVYPFRWIQGDYNGDGKTDIGIFHLKEGTWYFAVTRGTVPDMISRVDNGIGGRYTFEYANSSQFDNTGDDTIPDLPMNYKVCTKLTVSDGRSHLHGSYGEYSTYYEYEGGTAFSAFINGYKETDFFGFTRFSVVDAVGNKTVSEYYSTPYDDFRKNRALAGAVKRSRFLGSDRKEYAGTEYEYTVHEIVPEGAPRTPKGYTAQSFLIEPTEKREYFNNTLVKTTRSNIELTPNEYEMVSQSESVTDHYEDSIHAAVTVSSYSEFENVASTNQMRLKKKVSMQGTAHEVTVENVYFDDYGNPARQDTEYTGSGCAAAATRIMRYGYDDYGNRYYINDMSESGRSRETQIFFDDELHQFQKSVARFNADSITLYDSYEINYDIAFGSINKKTGPNGNSTCFEYDNYGRLVDEYTDVNGTKTHLQSYDYTADFPMSVKLTKYAGDGQAPVESRVFADGLGRVVHSISSAAATAGKRYVKSGRVVYDQAGRVIRQSQAHWAGDSEIDEYVPNYTDKHPTYTEYDASGRVRKVTMPKAENETGETSILYTYNDPWETVQRHSVGRTTRTVKNARGLVLYSGTTGVGDDGREVSTAVGFGYNEAGRRIAKFDLDGGAPFDSAQGAAAGPDYGRPSFDAAQGSGFTLNRSSDDNNVYWWYDGFGRVVATNDPDFGASQVSYNAHGEVVSSTDALGRTTTMSYDRLGRVMEKVLPGGEGSVVYTYDRSDYSDHPKGRLVSIDDSNQLKEFSYDELGRIVSEKRTMKDVGSWSGEAAFETHFHYDLLSRHREITYPEDPATGNRAVVTYSYSPMGVSGVSVTSGGVSKELITGISYNEFGQMDTVNRGNGTVTDYVYDIKGRLMELVTVDSNGHRVQDVHYDFKIDNSISAVENRPEVGPDGYDNSVVRYTYSYDGLNRLVHADGTYTRSTSGTNNRFERGYSYAANGNLTAKTMYDPETHAVQDNWVYAYTNHRVDSIISSRIDGTKFEMFYDAVGNMTGQRDRENNLAKQMDFDSDNRITQVIDPDTGNLVGKYFYDDQGFRVRKVARRFIDNEWKHVEVVYPSMYFGMEKQWTVEGEEIPGTGFGVNNIYLNGVRFAALTPEGDAQYYLTDQVDSVKVVVDDTGIPVSSFEYLPYGETWFQEGDDQHNPKYNSQELDVETGFYFYNARHYDPVIARFVTADSVVDGELTPIGWNRYCYVHGNPVVYRDPTGHEGEGPDLIDEYIQERGNVAPEDYNSYDLFMQPLVQERKEEQKAAEEKRIRDEHLKKYGHSPETRAFIKTPEKNCTDVVKRVAINIGTGIIWSTVGNPGDLPEERYNELYPVKAAKNPSEELGDKVTIGIAAVMMVYPIVKSQVQIKVQIPIKVPKIKVPKIKVRASKVGKLTKSQKKSIKSYKELIKEHKAKIKAYKKNPNKFDNKGFLKNAPNKQIRQKIINKRIQHLKHEIKTFKENTKKIYKGEK